MFNAELLEACRVLELSKTLQNNRKVTVLLDLQTAITQIQSTESGLGQILVIWAYKAASWLQKCRIKVIIQ